MAFTLGGNIHSGGTPYAGSTAATSHNYPVANAVPAGKMVVVYVACDNGGSAAGDSTEISVSDSRGNTYVRAKEQTQGGAAQSSATAGIFYSVITTALQVGDNITATVPNGKCCMAGEQWSFGAGNSIAVETTAGQGGNGSLAALSMAGAVNGQQYAAVVMAAIETNSTSGIGYNLFEGSGTGFFSHSATTAGGSSAANMALRALRGVRTVSSTTPQWTCSGTASSGDHRAIAVLFKEVVTGTTYNQNVGGEITPAGDPAVKFGTKTAGAIIASGSSLIKKIARNNLAGVVASAAAVIRQAKKYVSIGSTNYALYSQTLSNWTTGSGATAGTSASGMRRDIYAVSVTAGGLTTAPDGGGDAQALLETTAVGQHLRESDYQYGLLPQGTQFVYSDHVARGLGRDWVALGCYDGNSDHWDFCWFDLLNGVKGYADDGFLETYMVPAANGFWRVGYRWQVQSGASASYTYAGTYIAQGDGAVSATPHNGANRPQYAGDVTKGLYVWGAMMDIGADRLRPYLPNLSTGIARESNVATAGTLSVSKLFVTLLTATIASAATLLKNPVKRLLAGVIGSGAVLALKTSRNNLAGVIASGGALIRRTIHKAAGTIASAGVVSRTLTYARAFTAAIASAGSLTVTQRLARGLSATIASGGALTRKLTRPLAAAIASAGALLSTFIPGTMLVGGTIALAGTITRKLSRALAATIASAGAVLRILPRAFTGSIALAGTVATRAGRIFGGVIASAGALLKKLSRALAGAVASSGALTVQQRLARALSGAIALAGSVVRKLSTALSGAIQPIGSATKKLGLALAGVITSAGSVSLRKVFLQYPAGVIASAGSIVRRITHLAGGALIPAGEVVRKLSRALAGAVALAGALTKRLGRALAGVIASTGSLNIQQRLARALGGTVALAGAVLRRAGKLLAALVASAGALTITQKLARSLGGTVAMGGALIRRLSRALSGAVSLAGNAQRRVGRALSGAVASSGAARLITSKLLGGAAALSGFVVRTAGRFMDGTVALGGVISRAMALTRDGAITILGETTRLATRALAGAVAVGRSFRLTAQKNLEGSVALNGILVAVLSGITALYGYIQPVGSVMRRVAKTLAGRIGIIGRFIAWRPGIGLADIRARVASAPAVLARWLSGVAIWARFRSKPAINADDYAGNSPENYNE
jgi:hypothetical protein